MDDQFSFDVFKLHDNPFSRTAGPNHPYLSSSFREALASLYYGLEYGSRILLLSADAGLGKTTLLRHLERQMRSRARTLFVSCDSDKASNPHNVSQVLRTLLLEIGGGAANDDLHTMQIQIDEMLPTLARAEDPFILLLDYNENASGPALELLHHLTNLESLQRRLLRVVMAGPTAVVQELQRSEFADDIRRVPLARLTAAEVESYIEYRLRLVGWGGGSLFTAKAYALIAERSSAKPSAINDICFNLLQNLSNQGNGRSGSAAYDPELPLDEPYVDFVISGRKSTSDALTNNGGAAQTAPFAPSPNRRTATLVSIVLILVVAIAGLWYVIALRAHSAKHVITSITLPFTTRLNHAVFHDRPLARLPNPARAIAAVGVVITSPTAEAGSGPAHDAETVQLSDSALRAASARPGTEPGEPTTVNAVAARPTKGKPLVPSSSPTIPALKNGEYATEPIGKKALTVSSAPFSQASASKASTSSSVASRKRVPQAAVAARLPVTAGEDTLAARRSADEMADYEIRLGDAYMNMGDYDKAVLSFSRAIALAPDDEEAEERLRRARRAKTAEEDILQ